jgi:hypothetical protein
MALWKIRLSLQDACDGAFDDEGYALWDKVGEKFDAIAHDNIITRIASTNTCTIKEWRAAVGEVFRRVREYAAPIDKAEVFFQTIDNGAAPIFSNGHYDMSGGYYKAMEQGRGFDQHGYLTQNGVFSSKDYQKTRALYLSVAQAMAQRYLSDDRNSEQMKLRSELENYFPEMAIARRREHAPEPY